MDSSATHQLTSQFPALRLSVARRMAGYRERLAKRVSDEMAQRSWSVDDLAYKSGVSAKTIKRLQNAKHKRPAEGEPFEGGRAPGALLPNLDFYRRRRT